MVLASTTRTPVTRLVLGSYSRLVTTWSDSKVRLLVLRAAGKVTAWVEKYAPNEQPRAHMERLWQRALPCSGLSSVMLAVRVEISLRPGMARSSRSLTQSSATFIGCGGWYSPSGNCGNPSLEPAMPAYFST